MPYEGRFGSDDNSSSPLDGGGRDGRLVMSMHVPTAAEIVLAAFPGQGFVKLRQASEFLGIAYQTARHHLAAGTFPVATVTFGKRKRLVPIPALISYYHQQLDKAGLTVSAGPVTSHAIPITPAKRRPGRPRKLEGGVA